MGKVSESLKVKLLVAGMAVASVAGAARAQDSGAAEGVPQAITLGERVNAFIDNLLALGNRLLELPLFMILPAVALVCVGLMLGAKVLVKREKYQRMARGMRVAAVIVVALAFVFVEDHKMAQLQNAVNELRARNSSETMALLNGPGRKENSTPLPDKPRAEKPAPDKAMAKPGEAATKPGATALIIPPKEVSKEAPKEVPTEYAQATPAETPKAAQKRTTFLFNDADAAKVLKQQFGQVGAQSLIYDRATDLVLLRMPNPLVRAFLVMVDLKAPGVEVKLGGSLSEKTLTSTFAKANDCTLAINGEAGVSPRPGSGLGEWRGYLVKGGQVLSRENAGTPRPYLSFDKQNHATFTAAAVKDRALAADSFNVMWGRLDAIIDGVVQTADERNRQPRTAMGINKDGSLLYLLVVDGRQPNYSMGFTRADVGQLLKAYGAYNGMLCDEGGSSCMYLKKFGGISNIPSDNQGEERVTYTHFGITLHDPQ